MDSHLPDDWRSRSSWTALGPVGPDGFAPNISVERREREGTVTARELAAEARARLAEQRLPALEIGRELEVQVAGVDAVDLEFSHGGGEGRPRERFTRRLLCLVKGGSAYEIVLTATARGYRSGDRETFNRFVTDLDL